MLNLVNNLTAEARIIFLAIQALITFIAGWQAWSRTRNLIAIVPIAILGLVIMVLLGRQDIVQGPVEEDIKNCINETRPGLGC